MNLINQSTIEAGDLLYANGDIDTTAAGYFHTTYIPIIPQNNIYYFSIDNTGFLHKICFYNEAGSYISGGMSSTYWNSTTKFISSIPSAAKFIRLSFYWDNGANPVSSNTDLADIIALNPTLSFTNNIPITLNTKIDSNINKKGQLNCFNITEGFNILQFEKTGNILTNELYEF